MGSILSKLVEMNRTYRRFYNEHIIEREVLENLVNLARLSPSGRNLQPLKYFLSCDTETNSKIYPNLMWAGYLTDWNGPEKHEQPSAYVIMLIDKNLTAGTPEVDQGICCQSILLGAVEQGLGGCIIASVKRKELQESLNILSNFEIALVIAIGKPKEDVRIVSLIDDSIKYYRDDRDIHYVPKRELKDIIIG